MVAHVLRLRLALLFGSLRRERRMRSIGLGIVVAIVTAVVCLAVLTLADERAATAGTVIVMGSAAVLLGFLVGPILVGAIDQLDPRRFAVFGVDTREMPGILALAAVLSVPSLALLAVNVCVCVVAIRLGVAWPVAVLTSLMTFGSTLLTARIGMAVNALLLPERRSRELTALFALAVLVIAFPVAVFFAALGWNDAVPTSIGALSSTVGATPLAAPARFLFALATGDMVGAWFSGILALATAATLWVLWTRLVTRLLTQTERPAAVREHSGLGWFGILPSSAFGAIASRSLVYWLRDRRYIMNLVVVPVAGIFAVLPLIVAGVPTNIAALVPVPVMALFFGWLPHNDIAYDSTALWTHVASGVRGIHDRLGRLVPVAAVAVPVLAVSMPLTFLWIEDWSLLLPLSGVAASLLLSGWGLSSLVSVVAPYGVSRPGDSPFQQPQRASSNLAYGPAAAFLGAIALSVPTIWLFVLTSVAGPQFAAVTLWVGLATGGGVMAAGVVLGSRAFERDGERLMEFVETA